MYDLDMFFQIGSGTNIGGTIDQTSTPPARSVLIRENTMKNIISKRCILQGVTIFGLPLCVGRNFGDVKIFFGVFFEMVYGLDVEFSATVGFRYKRKHTFSSGNA